MRRLETIKTMAEILKTFSTSDPFSQNCLAFNAGAQLSGRNVERFVELPHRMQKDIIAYASFGHSVMMSYQQNELELVVRTKKG